MSRGPASGGASRLRVLAAVLGTSLATLLVWELGLRAIDRVDADGNVDVLRIRLRPYHTPVERVRELFERLEEAPERSILAYDADLGWVVQDTGSPDAPYFYNRDGIRTSPGREVHPAEPPAGVRRIALFGDSFAHGSDVPFDDSLGAQLERRLRERGQETEVLNFGVPGYGMDQALLRLRARGREFSPDLVLFGFQAENIMRNVNIVRPLFFRGTGIPFSKPRFVLRDGALRVVNQPAIRGEAYLRALEDMASWELAEHEAFYAPEDYAPRPWLSRSRLLALLDQLLVSRRRVPDDEPFYGPDTGPGRLAMAIVDAFAEEAREIGARFAIVHLPTTRDLAALAETGEMDHAGILAVLRERHHLVDPTSELAHTAAERGTGALFMRPDGGHYNPLGNARVADVAADALAP